LDTAPAEVYGLHSNQLLEYVIYYNKLYRAFKKLESAFKLFKQKID
jgi:hypothetical protein